MKHGTPGSGQNKTRHAVTLVGMEMPDWGRVSVSKMALTLGISRNAMCCDGLNQTLWVKKGANSIQARNN